MQLFLIILMSLAPFVCSLEGNWCTKNIRVRKTKTVWVTKHRPVTKSNWWGNTYTIWEPYKTWEPDYYYTFETTKFCCSGYRQEQNKCVPACNPLCPTNSECILPNQCACNAGYQHAAGQCRPVCTTACPSNASCVEPEICACNTGYKTNYSIDGVLECSPYCVNGCQQNSHCVRPPNECVCDVGYHQWEDGFCEPICEPKCSDVYSFCEAPNKCVCIDGYKRDALDNSTANQCMPICTDGCPLAHSICVHPDQCQCDEGYQMNETETECEPICAENCPEHSRCVSPNQCTCDEGYHLVTLAGPGLYCEPDCPENCSRNGKCITPNVCECFAGYEMPKIEEKFATMPMTNLCQPKCSGGCEHGLCFAPEQCVCNPGYLMGPNNTCAPVCSFGCVHGVCVEPEICNCEPGYRFVSNSIHICEAVCEPKCINADCVAPDVCICWQHFEPNTTTTAKGNMDAQENISSYACKPACINECANGTCIAPNVCQCNHGFDLVENKCVPQCGDACNFGDCVAPGVCRCWDGNVGIENTTEVGTNLCSPSVTTSDYSAAPVPSSEGPRAALILIPLEFEMESGSGSGMESDSESGSNLGSGLGSAIASRSSDSLKRTSVTIMEDSTTITIDPMQTLYEIISYYTTTPQSLVLGTACAANCRCWVKANEEADIKQQNFLTNGHINCLHLCVDDFDQPCFNLSKCECNRNELKLYCNLDDTEFPDNQLSDQRVVEYVCQISTRINVAAAAAAGMNVEPNRTAISWIIIASSIVGLLILIGTIFAIWCYFANNKNGDEGEYNVSYQP